MASPAGNLEGQHSLLQLQRMWRGLIAFSRSRTILGLGFLVMAAAAGVVSKGQKVWPTWLITTYLLHSIGELCLSPVGLSSVTKLAPVRLRGQLMGTWFLATSLGNLMLLQCLFVNGF